MSFEQRKAHSTYVINVLGRGFQDSLDVMSDEDLYRLTSIFRNPLVSVSVNNNTVPHGVSLITPFGNIRTDHSMTNITSFYINGTEFTIKENGLDALEKITSGYEGVKDVADQRRGRQNSGRRVRSFSRAKLPPIEEITEQVLDDLRRSNLTYDTIFTELSGLFSNQTDIDLGRIVDDIFANDVPEELLADFLVNQSAYRNRIISQVYGVQIAMDDIEYEFETIQADDSFLGRIISDLGFESGEYDAELNTLKLGDRLISNLPKVDHNGVFSNGDKRYIPYYKGYFVNNKPGERLPRVERLRVVDPVQSSIDALKLEFELTKGDLKFRTILDVTRNLPDFDNHPYGQEILETLKHKIVFDKSYSDTNTVVKEFTNKLPDGDDLGAVELTMLDEESTGYIDPYVTSNGANLGRIVYMADGVTINEDGSLNPSETTRFSKVGQIIDSVHGEFDNVGRNQLSGTNILTSTDAKKLVVYYGEFPGWNADDANVVSEKGANAFNTALHTGDKVTDAHGNKGVSSIVMSDLSDEDIAERKLEPMVEFFKNNPHIDMVVSSASIASRENFGVVAEGVNSEKSDVVLNDGTVVKNGAVEMLYFKLPQTADKKSKDYGIEGNGRNYSNLFRYALQSKVGKGLYEKAFIDQETRDAHIDEVCTAFQNLGYTFEDEHALIDKGNVRSYVSSPASVEASHYQETLATSATIRLDLMEKMVNNQINIILPPGVGVIRPGTAYTTVDKHGNVTEHPGEFITDEDGNNIIPIRVVDGDAIPYRYTKLFDAISMRNNQDAIQKAYDYVASVDYNKLTKKDNLLKHIDTMTFRDGAETLVLIPDPSLKLGEVRTSNPDPDDPRLVMHRDPAIQSGNVISMTDVGGGIPGTLAVHPAVFKMIDGDSDGDTVAANRYRNLALTDREKDIFFDKSNVVEQLNFYGQVFAGVDSPHFKAVAKASGVDLDQFTFDTGMSNQEMSDLIDQAHDEILANPKAYGAYGIDFSDTDTALNSLTKLANDGIKGDAASITHRITTPYTRPENIDVLKAVAAKSQLTGHAGSITNTIISDTSTGAFNKDLIRVSMDITKTMTQSVLQMKKNAKDFDKIYQGIIDMKTVIGGKYDIEKSRSELKRVTDGLIPPQAIDKFVDLVAENQKHHEDPTKTRFGTGTLNKTRMSTLKLAYGNETTFTKTLEKVSENVYERTRRDMVEAAQIEGEILDMLKS